MERMDAPATPASGRGPGARRDEHGAGAICRAGSRVPARIL